MYKQCLLENKTFNCIQHRIKSNPLSTDTLQIDKIALNNYDNKRLQSFNGITTYPYGANAFMVCYEELKIKQAFANYFHNQKLITAEANILFVKIQRALFKRRCASYTF